MLCGSATWAGPTLELRTNLIWKRSDVWFGGFSGAEVTDNGSQITLITDRSTLVIAKMRRQGGNLTSLDVQNSVTLRDAGTRYVKDHDIDAEGLAIGPDGALYISLERNARVERLTTGNWKTESLPTHPDFAHFDLNKGPEALAIHPNGTLYTLPERPVGRAFPLYASTPQGWRIAHAIPKRGPFLAVGADFDTQGRLYLLERAITPLGFRSRIRRLTLHSKTPGEETLLTSGPGRFDNLEALSVWTDPSGMTRLTLISDDNFLSIQRTQILEFTLTE